MIKRACITGISGQDGSTLAKILLEKGYEVYGTYRRLSTPNFWRLQAQGIFDRVNLIPMELIDESSAVEAVRISQPDEVYHLAAQSFVGSSFEQPIGTGNVTGLGVARMLEAVRQVRPKARFYNAASSELYGEEIDGEQNEDTPFRPVSPYSVAKLYGFYMTRIYRKAYGIFAVNGILFNHEGIYRGLEFVTRKISNGVSRIKLGLQKELVLGNLNARRDWGYAPEYMEAAWAMLQQDNPDDYVVATGESHSVGEFVTEAFKCVGLRAVDYIKIDEKYMRPCEVNYHRGNYKKAEKKFGWQPEVRFKELVRIMVNADLDRWQKWIDGEHFAWDAPNYPDEAKLLTKQARMER